MMVATRFALIVCLVCAVPAAAHAVQCQTPGGFDAWLASFKQEAAAQGISQRTITTALAGVTYDPNVVARDRKQGFIGVFVEFLAATSSRAIASRACSTKASRSFPAAWCHRGSTEAPTCCGNTPAR